MIGRSIAHYEIVDRLGEGGMGVVYRARDTRLDRTVALKFLPPDVAGDAERKQRFLREARAASVLDHPNIGRIHTVEEAEDGALFIVMACYDGQSLEARLRQGALPLATVLDLGLQIADGLGAAHAAGIVHRDLKPSNVLLTSDGGVRIIDFGLAKAAEASRLTRTGTALGTLPYMSPEQVTGESVDARTDVWSLGVVLYEMATGRRPFDARNDAALVYGIAHEAPARPSALRSDMPAALERLILRCLEKEPARRYASVGEVRAELQAMRERAAGAAGPRHAPGGLPSGARRTALIGAVVVVAAVLAVGTRLVLGGRGAVPTPSLAILPLQSLGPDAADAQLADAIAEDVYHGLSQVAALRVTSLRTSLRYRDAERGIRDIGRELDVAAVLDGSIRPAGDALRIALRLVDVRTDRTLWAGHYDRPRVGHAGIVGDVARSVAAALQVRLTREEAERIDAPPTDNPAAWEMLRMARQRWTALSPAVLDEAADLYRMAIEMDPGLAVAYGEAAFVHLWRWRLGNAGAEAETRAAVRLGLEADSTLAMAHFVTGGIHRSEGRLSDARRAYLRAIAYDPNLYFALNDLSVIELAVGRFDESLQRARQGFERAPDEANGFHHVALPLIALEADDAAERLLRVGLDRDTHIGGFGEFGRKPFNRIPMNLAVLEALRGDDAAALAWVRHGLDVHPDDLELLRTYGWVLVVSRSAEADAVLERLRPLGLVAPAHYAMSLRRRGETARADSVIDAALATRVRAIEAGRDDPDIPEAVAGLHALRGDVGAALDWLERAYTMGYRRTRRLQRLPEFDGLRAEPRFIALLERMDADVARMRARADLAGLPGSDAPARAGRRSGRER